MYKAFGNIDDLVHHWRRGQKRDRIVAISLIMWNWTMLTAIVEQIVVSNGDENTRCVSGANGKSKTIIKPLVYLLLSPYISHCYMRLTEHGSTIRTIELGAEYWLPRVNTLVIWTIKTRIWIDKAARIDCCASSYNWEIHAHSSGMVIYGQFQLTRPTAIDPTTGCIWTRVPIQIFAIELAINVEWNNKSSTGVEAESDSMLFLLFWPDARPAWRWQLRNYCRYDFIYTIIENRNSFTMEGW
jgi:hypothetical protein